MKIPKKPFNDVENFGPDLLTLANFMEENSLMTNRNFEEVQETLYAFLLKNTTRESKKLYEPYRDWLRNKLTHDEILKIENFVGKIYNARPGMEIGLVHSILPSVTLHNQDIRHAAQSHKTQSPKISVSSSESLSRSLSSSSNESLGARDPKDSKKRTPYLPAHVAPTDKHTDSKKTKKTKKSSFNRLKSKISISSKKPKKP